jgi:Fe-S cluster assembly ATP-binding protein
MLSLQNFHVSISKKEILKGVSITINPGEVHAVMGPNGAGKTTLAMALMGHPGYKIKNKSKIKINGRDVSKLPPEERAKYGLFVSFQHPVEVQGVSFLSFLRTAYKSLYPDKKIPLSEFKEEVKSALKKVDLDESFMQRSLNEGFSGGEKKRAEIAQLFVLKPQFAILDEIDSGLDVDSLRIVAKTIAEIVKKQQTGILLITHYQRILYYLKANIVHVLVDGKIKKSGTIKLVKKIEKEGYAAV